MKRSLFSLVIIALAAGVFTAGQSGAPQTATATQTTRTRMHEPAPPVALRGARVEPVERFAVNTSGLPNPLAEPWTRDAVSGAEYRHDEVLVQFREGASAADKAQALRLAGGARITRVLPTRWAVVTLDDGQRAEDAVASFAADRDVDSAALNYRRYTQQVRPNDEFYRFQWNLDAINMPGAWQINPGARNDVVVAVVDTGLNTVSDTFIFTGPYGRFALRFAKVPDLVDDARIVVPYDFVYEDNTPLDLGGHGTHVAGTIAQQTGNGIGVAGVAYNVKLMPLKVLSGGSFGAWDDVFVPGHRAGSDDLVARAIHYAADNGAHVINLSLGGPAASPIIRDAIRYGVERGAFVAMAAGNAAERGNPVEYPAAYGPEIDGAITVGAVDRTLRRAPYSGYRAYLEICAPGGVAADTISYDTGVTQVGYDEAWTWPFLTSFQRYVLLFFGFRPRFDQFELVAFSGTSMATPHVSGMAALLYSQGIRDPRAIEEAIKRFARPIGARPDECGAGLIDPRRALRGLGLAR